MQRSSSQPAWASRLIRQPVAELRRRLALLLLACLLSPLAWADALQELRFKRIDERQGLPDASVVAFAQDERGLIWMATVNGLARWDGQQMRSFVHDPARADSLSHGMVWSIHRQQGALWLGTSRGLDRLDLASERIERLPVPEGVPTARSYVVAVRQRDAQSIWVGFAGGLYWMDLATRRFTAVDAPDVGALRDLVVDAQGGVWVAQGTTVRLVHQDGSAGPQLDLAGGLQGSERARFSIRTLMLDAQRRLWASSPQGMQVLSLRDGQLHPEPLAMLQQLPKAASYGMLCDRDGDVWIAYAFDGGLWHWSPRSGRLRQSRHQDSIGHSLSIDSLAGLFQDRAGNLWVGSWGGGVNVADLGASGFSSYQRVAGDAQSLTTSGVGAVLPAGPDEVWLGLFAGALNRLHLPSGRVQAYAASEVGENNIKSLAHAGPGQLWIGGQDGLTLFDIERRRHQRIDLGNETVAGASIAALLVDAQQRLWIATAAGIHRREPDGRLKTFRAAPRAGGLVNEIVDSLLLDRAGNLWAGSKAGMARWDASNDVFVAQAQGTPTGVRQMLQAADGRIWLATDQGLAEWLQRDGAWVMEPRSAALGVPPGWVMNVLEDSRARLWLGMQQGLVRVDLATARSRLYPMHEGHVGSGFGYGTQARMPDGSLLFASAGLLRVQPERVADAPPAPPVLLSDLRLFNRSLVSEDQALLELGIEGPLIDARRLRVRHDQSMLSFVFSALDFTAERHQRYAWQLQGFDRDWVYGKPGEGIATYTNLDPGRYVLLARAANADGAWSTQPLKLELEVLPPWWGTWWARGGGVLLLALVLLSWHGWRTRELRLGQILLERRVRERTEDLVAKQLQLQDQVQRTERARRDITQLSEIGRELTASLDAVTVTEILYRHVQALVRADIFGVGLVNWSARQVRFEHVYEGGRRVPPYARSLDAPEQPAAQCVLGRKELLIERFEHDTRLVDSYQAAGGLRLVSLAQAHPARSGLYVPMMLKGRVIGVITVLADDEAAYDEHDLDILRTLAAYAAVALDNAEAHETLASAQRQLVEREKLASLGALVAGVAHELNTPIGNSLLMASTLRDRGREFNARAESGQLRRSDLSDFCNAIESSGEVLLSSLEQAAGLVRSFKQVAVDQTSEKRRRFELKTACRELAATLAARIRLGEHELQLDLPDDVWLDSYPGPLGQVLSNLIMNAMLHGFDGRRHGQMRLHGRRVGVRGGAEQVELVFSDNGAGIAPQHLPHVFDPFFTTRMGQGGNGLGLHVCYNIVHQLLGGSISVASTQGVGTAFTIALPLVAPQHQSDALHEEGGAAA